MLVRMFASNGMFAHPPRPKTLRKRNKDATPDAHFQTCKHAVLDQKIGLSSSEFRWGWQGDSGGGGGSNFFLPSGRILIICAQPGIRGRIITQLTPKTVPNMQRGREREKERERESFMQCCNGNVLVNWKGASHEICQVYQQYVLNGQQLCAAYQSKSSFHRTSAYMYVAS